MDEKYPEQEVIYPAVERALSIALCELGSKETETVGLGRYRTTYTVSCPQGFLYRILPVLQKYINIDSIEKCIKKAQKIALARKVRGWSWWSSGAFFLCMPCLAIHISFYLIVFLLSLSIISIIFYSRKIVGKIWKYRETEPDADAIAFEKMINLCKKNSLQICIDYLMKK